MKNQKPDLRPGKFPSASFLIWIFSGLDLVAMLWFLLSMGRYGTHETQPWLASAVATFTAAYGILMLLLWPYEETSPISPKQKPE
jgi:hypothetical protein